MVVLVKKLLLLVIKFLLASISIQTKDTLSLKKNLLMHSTSAVQFLLIMRLALYLTNINFLLLQLKQFNPNITLNPFVIHTGVSITEYVTDKNPFHGAKWKTDIENQNQL